MTILAIAGSGPLGMAVAGALEGLGEQAREASPSDDDLFMKALDCRAIVHAPSPDILPGTLKPAPDPARILSVLRACNAPGVRLLVLVIPAGNGYEPELELVRHHGIPYVIVETAPLEEELSRMIASEGGAVWLPKDARARLSKRAAVHAAVVEALTNDELQGRSITVDADEVSLAIALRSAVESAGGAVAVHAVPRFVDRATRTVRGWLGMKDPPLRQLCNSLAAD